MRVIKVRIGPDHFIRLKSSDRANGLPDLRVKLHSVEVGLDRIAWVLETDKGQLISGVLGTNSPLNLPNGIWAGSYVALSIPTVIHSMAQSGLRYEFVFRVPSLVVLDTRC